MRMSTTPSREPTYADIEALPPHLRGEIVRGKLIVSSRPSPPHLLAGYNLGSELYLPFHRGQGGPGGWWILPEPECHIREGKPIIPDLAGWRRERMPTLPESNRFELPPDWVCEILSPSTGTDDWREKLTVYAQNGVPFAWYINPLLHLLHHMALSGNRGTRPRSTPVRRR
jgi:Uma2 family endonuclease